FFFSSRRRHTRSKRDWSSDVCSSDLFTGSTETGRKIVESTAASLARVTLELGGNDAGIVLDDVNAKEIAEGLFWGAFINTGQTCAAMMRLYVHESIYDVVIEAII